MVEMRGLSIFTLSTKQIAHHDGWRLHRKAGKGGELTAQHIMGLSHKLIKKGCKLQENICIHIFGRAHIGVHNVNKMITNQNKGSKERERETERERENTSQIKKNNEMKQEINHHCNSKFSESMHYIMATSK